MLNKLLDSYTVRPPFSSELIFLELLT